MNDLKLYRLQTYIKDGCMTTNSCYYPDGMTFDQIREDFLSRRLVLGKDLGFNGRLMYFAAQRTKTGSYKIIDEEFIRKNPNGWVDIKEDILVMSDKTPRVVIGHSVADCPVVILHDRAKNVVAVSHCSPEMTNMGLPKYMVEALRDAYNSKVSDMFAYISACAGPNWDFDKYPQWATNRLIWSDNITQRNNKYCIDIKEAITKQLDAKGVSLIMSSSHDTIGDSKLYSNCAASKGIQYKKGLHFAGAYFK